MGGVLETFALDKSKPIADQIVTRLMGSIQSGALPQGTRLPSIRALAQRLGVNRNTVAHAIHELAEKGYVSTRFGAGSTVSRPLPLPLPALGEPADGGTAVARTLSAADWERRLARQLGNLLSRSSAPLYSPRGTQPINLFQHRPNTDLFPLERFRQCLNTVLRRSGRALMNYGTPAGYLPLREQIALRLRANHIEADPSRVLIISGSQQGIDLLARAFLDPGDGVVVESPMYSIALKIFMVNGARLFPYLVGRDGVSLAELASLRQQQPPKLFYAVPNFQNPTTHSYSLEEKTRLLREAYRLGSLVVEDASDCELHQDPGRWPPLAALDRSERVIYVNTFSKTLVPALRVGYLAAPAVVVRRLTELKEMTDLSHSLILQAAIAEFMERGYFDEHVERVRGFYAGRMARVLEMLERALPAEVAFTRPEGGLCVWVELPLYVPTQALFERLLNRGVLVSPGALYQPAPVGRNGLRLCVANEPEERLAEAFRVLGGELEQVLRQPPPTMQEQEYQPIH